MNLLSLYTFDSQKLTLCVYVCMCRDVYKLALALSPPQTSPLMFSHWRSSHSQFLPWMRVSPGGWQVHCPQRHWPTKKVQIVLMEQTFRDVFNMSPFSHWRCRRVEWLISDTQIDLPDKMSPGIVENLCVNRSIVWTLTHPHMYTHLEKLSFYLSLPASVTRGWTEWAFPPFIMHSNAIFNTC